MYIVYTRKSTDDSDNQKNSIPFQKKVCKEYAKNKGLQIADDSVDEIMEDGMISERHSAYKSSAISVSGAGLVEYQIERPKFMQMISWLLEGKYEGVIVLCWDRISRNEQSDLIVKELIDKHGIKIEFVQADYDQGTSAGALHRDVDGMFARHHSRVTSEKVKSAFEKLRSEHRCVYSSPIGYIDEGSNLKKFDPERSPLIKRIFELYATGEWAMSDLVKWANEQGLTSKPKRRRRTKSEMLKGVEIEEKGSKPINKSTIGYLLSNPFYIGKLKHDEEYFDGIHPPLISNELFSKVQAMLKKKCVTVKYHDQAFFTYRNFFRCADCGRVYTPYRAKKNGEVYYSSRCKDGCTNAKRNIHERHFDEIMKGVMDRVHFSDEELEEIEKGAKSGLKKVASQRDSELEDVNRRRRKVLKDLDYLKNNKMSLLREGAYSPLELREESERLIGQLKEVDAVMEAYTESEEEMLDFVLSFSELVKRASLLYEVAYDIEKRKLVNMMLSELTLKDGKMASLKAQEDFEPILNRANVQSGSGGGIRTHDISVNSRTLYH